MVVVEPVSSGGEYAELLARGFGEHAAPVDRHLDISAASLVLAHESLYAVVEETHRVAEDGLRVVAQHLLAGEYSGVGGHLVALEAVIYLRPRLCEDDGVVAEIRPQIHAEHEAVLGIPLYADLGREAR